MSPNRNRKLVPGNPDLYDDFGLEIEQIGETDNPEFETFDPKIQALIDARFQKGITRRMMNDAIIGQGVTAASRDCAKRFRDAAAKRVATATIGDSVRTDARRRRERRNGGVR